MRPPIEVSTYGTVMGSRVTFLINTENEPVTVHFAHVLNRVNKETKETYKCAYASIPTEWWKRLDHDLTDKLAITFTAVTAPHLEVGGEWTQMKPIVEDHYWIGWDWIDRPEADQPEFPEIHRLIQQKLGIIKQAMGD